MDLLILAPVIQEEVLVGRDARGLRETRPPGPLSMKVSDKGGLSIYGANPEEDEAHGIGVGRRVFFRGPHPIGRGDSRRARRQRSTYAPCCP